MKTAKLFKNGRSQAALSQFLTPLEIVPYDDKAAVAYGQIRSHLAKKCAAIGAMDLLIGAHARSIPVILVTNNHRKFIRIQGLQVENWTK